MTEQIINSAEVLVTPPAAWDEWALEKSRAFVKRTEEVNHPRAMLVSYIHMLLIMAMEYAYDKKIQADAARYRWLCNNNFDRDSMQILTFQQWTEPHSQTGEPQPWSARVRGGALDAIIDAEMAKEPK